MNLRAGNVRRQLRDDRLYERLDELDELAGEWISKHCVGHDGIWKVGGGTDSLVIPKDFIG